MIRINWSSKCEPEPNSYVILAKKYISYILILRTRRVKNELQIVC